MEAGPAIFMGVVFALFGGGLAVWTGVRVRQGRPVAHGVNPVASAALAGLVSVLSSMIAFWGFSRL